MDFHAKQSPASEHGATTTASGEARRRARARTLWRYVGEERPPFAAAPGPGQRSVWDFPRPPRVEPVMREVTVRLGSVLIARTRNPLLVCETASPPTWYLPEVDVQMKLLQPAAGASHCEWKGEARYASIVDSGARLDAAAFLYPSPLPGYEGLRGRIAFYPQQLDCRVDGLRVVPQPGRYYAGWITPELVGPFKGERGSEGW